MSYKNKSLGKILLAEAIIVALATLLYYFDVHKFIYSKITGDIIYSKTQSNCDLGEAVCRADFDNGYIEIQSLTKPILPLKENQFVIKIFGIEPFSVDFEINSVSMNMGTYPFKLIKENNIYTSIVTLPACSFSKSMIWESNIVINTTSKRYGAKFKFLVK